jgi:hypothetical protein
MAMSTDQKEAAGELLAIAGAALLFLCAVPVAYMLFVSLVSGAYTLGDWISLFLHLPPWWIAFLTGLMCFRIRTAVLGNRKP